MLRKVLYAVSVAVVMFMVAGAARVAEGGDPGMVVLAMGGGSITEAQFIADAEDEATFAFFGGYDNEGALKGSFFVKRLTSDGVVAALSKGITSIETGFDGCSWMSMTGMADFMPTWSNKHYRDHPFTLHVWDCDSYGDGPDMIWFEVRRPDTGAPRPALSLVESCVLAGGNILIP